MVWLIVLGVIVGIIALIMLIPVGADVGYENGELSVSAKVCGVMLKLLPRKPADESKPRKEKKPKKEKKQRTPEEKEAFRKKIKAAGICLVLIAVVVVIVLSLIHI